MAHCAFSAVFDPSLMRAHTLVIQAECVAEVSSGIEFHGRSEECMACNDSHALSSCRVMTYVEFDCEFLSNILQIYKDVCEALLEIFRRC